MPRSDRFRLAIVVFASTSLSCTTVIPITPLEVRPESVHTVPASIQTVCSRLGWNTCSVWDFTDDQRLTVRAPNQPDSLVYGPWAYIAPAPQLETWTDFSTARVVAMIRIESTSPALPSEYQALQMSAGNNCVYLRRSGGVYLARVRPVEPAGDPCPVTGTGPDLAVRAVDPPSSVPNSTVPATARFHEGMSGGTVGHPMFGFKCASQWCVVMPATPAVDTARLPHKFEEPARMTWETHGWHDVQHLAVPDAAGQLRRSHHRVSIIPTPGLSGLTAAHFESGFQHVATVRFWQKPTAQYASKWAFRKGRNELWIRKSGNNWQGELRAKGKFLGFIPVSYVHPVHVRWHAHTRPFAKAARFLWRPDDEGLWVACENGCCEVSGGGSFSGGGAGN